MPRRWKDSPLERGPAGPRSQSPAFPPGEASRRDDWGSADVSPLTHAWNPSRGRTDGKTLSWKVACRWPDGFHPSDDKTRAQGADGDRGIRRATCSLPPASPCSSSWVRSLYVFESEMSLSSWFLACFLSELLTLSFRVLFFCFSFPPTHFLEVTLWCPLQHHQSPSFLKYFYWATVDLQYCVSFRCRAKWFI